jgi:hypothetical protein
VSYARRIISDGFVRRDTFEPVVWFVEPGVDEVIAVAGGTKRFGCLAILIVIGRRHVNLSFGMRYRRRTTGLRKLHIITIMCSFI